jgi:transcriptional regulator with XRE-family HTH domain
MSKDFPALLKAYRERAKLSQSRLAAITEPPIDRSFMSRLEKGERVPSWRTVDHLADAMKLRDEDRDMLLMAAGFLPPARQRQAMSALRPEYV